MSKRLCFCGEQMTKALALEHIAIKPRIVACKMPLVHKCHNGNQYQSEGREPSIKAAARGGTSAKTGRRKGRGHGGTWGQRPECTNRCWLLMKSSHYFQNCLAAHVQKTVLLRETDDKGSSTGAYSNKTKDRSLYEATGAQMSQWEPVPF